MRLSGKPVRKCYPCPLNLGDRCWFYPHPRAQWRDGRRCPGFDDARLHREYVRWSKQPAVKTRKELRREFFRTKRRTQFRFRHLRARH